MRRLNWRTLRKKTRITTVTKWYKLVHPTLTIHNTTWPTFCLLAMIYHVMANYGTGKNSYQCGQELRSTLKMS